MKIKLFAVASLAVITALILSVAVSYLRLSAASYTTLSGAASFRNPWHLISLSSSPPGASGNYSQQATSDTTMNWSGYASSKGTYTSITGSWKIPNVSSDTPVAADATWIGIGGDTSNDLIQVGTQNVSQSGFVSSGTFFEQLPNTAETIPTVNVTAGDNVAAAIKESSTGMWNVSIKDTTNGESFSNTVPYNSSESSAEWIEEAPSSGQNIMPLDDFGSVTFTGATTTINGKTVSLAGSKPQALTMDNNTGQSLTDSSSLNASGNGFTIERTSANSSAPDGYTENPGWGHGHHEPNWQVWSQGGWSNNPDPESAYGSGWQSQPTGSYYIYFN